MSNATNNTETQNATATKKAPSRLLIPLSDRAAYAALPEEDKPKYMNDEEQKAFEKKNEGYRTQYNLRLQAQATNDQLKALREKEAKDREEAKAKREKETKIKQIIADVKKDEVQFLRDKPLAENQVILNRMIEAGVTEEEREKTFERIKNDSVKGSSSRLLPAKPAYELSHSLVMVKQAELAPPTDGGKPDITLANSLRRSAMIQPFLVAPIMDGETFTGKYHVLDGKRRYWTMEADTDYPAVVVTGFPDEATQEKAEVIVNRVRNLNVLSTAQTLTRMRVRGVEDTELRRDLGFKTGEIDKIVSVTDLGASLQEAIKAGAITPTVALSIAKLPANLRDELHKDWETRKKEDSNARISEADVNNIRQKRAADAIKRDNPTLAGLADATPPLDEKQEDGVKSKSKETAPAKSAKTK